MTANKVSQSNNNKRRRRRKKITHSIHFFRALKLHSHLSLSRFSFPFWIIRMIIIFQFEFCACGFRFAFYFSVCTLEIRSYFSNVDSTSCYQPHNRYGCDKWHIDKDRIKSVIIIFVIIVVSHYSFGKHSCARWLWFNIFLFSSGAKSALGEQRKD